MWQFIYDKYYCYKKGDYEVLVFVVLLFNNGFVGVMVLFYGEVDFVCMVGLGVSVGYDCDNQVVMFGGLFGVMYGFLVILKNFMYNLGLIEWQKLFNDLYVNYVWDDIVVYMFIFEIVDCIVVVVEQVIFQQGGCIEGEGVEVVYVIFGGC